MSLIKDIATIKTVLPKLVSTTSDFSSMPDFGATENKYIIPITGSTLYNSLVASYQAETLDPDETKLVKNLQRAIVPYAYLDDIGLYILMLQDSGAKKISQGGTEPVRSWEVQELKNTLIKKATEAVDAILFYLFENRSLYPEWTASQEYSKLKTLLIRTGKDFNEQLSLFQPQRTYFILKSVMNDVQRLFIQETIGKDLLEYLRDKEEPTADESNCIHNIKKAIAFFTVAKACRQFSVSFTDMGFTILGEKTSNSLENTMNQPLDAKLLDMKITECMNEGNAYLELSRSELVTLFSKGSATEDFKTAFSSGPLKNYIKQEDRTSGNENTKSYRLP